MFQQYFQYTKLPSSLNDEPQRKSKGLSRFRYSYRRLLLPLILVCLVISSFLYFGNLKAPVKLHSEPQVQWITSFQNETRPSWLDTPSVSSPLTFRVAVLSHPKEVTRRQIIRDTIFKGVNPNEISIEYSFIVGLPEDQSLFKEKGSQKESLLKEQEEHGDLVIWDTVEEYNRLSQKRYFALKWSESGSFSNPNYDYFMTMDSDTFVRFGALARRLPTIYEREGKKINPAEDPVMVARMRPHFLHWLGTVSDESTTDDHFDLQIDGPWYDYPIGIGYMFSSYLVKQLLAANPPLPHHIAYPCDDVMIGSWISSLKVYPDPEHTYRVSKVNPWNLEVPIRPDPLLPHRVETIIINDHGWHDYTGRANIEEIGGPIGWDSVCIHHVRDEELKMLRDLEEFQGEWD